MNGKKFKMLKRDTIKIGTHTLYRIKALKDFSDVKKGDLGGYIEKEENLSHIGNCWVYNNARVFGEAAVFDDARVYDYTKVYDSAEVFGNAEVFDIAMVYGNAEVFDTAMVYGNAEIYNNAKICNDAVVCGNAKLSHRAYIESIFDYCTISGFGSKARTTTFYKCNDGNIRVHCGCFNGTLKEFKKQVKETHGDNQYAKEYLAIVKIVKNKLKVEQKEED